MLSPGGQQMVVHSREKPSIGNRSCCLGETGQVEAGQVVSISGIPRSEGRILVDRENDI